MVNKRLIIGLASGVLMTTLALAGLAFAQGATPQAQATASATTTAGAASQAQATPGATAQSNAAKPKGPRGAQAAIFDSLQTAIAQALGMTRADWDAQLAKGQTPLQIAQAKGQTQAQFTQLVKDAAAKVLQQAVTAGTLTQAQADQITQRLAADPLAFLGPGRGFGHGRGGGPQFAIFDSLQTAIAQALGMTRADWDAQIAKGQTPLQIAQAKGQTQAQFTQLVKDTAAKVLQQAVTAGTLTQAQADKITQRLAANPLAFIGPGRGFGYGRGFGPGHGPLNGPRNGQPRPITNHS